DARSDTVSPGVISDSLGMVAGGCCNHATRTFFRVESEQLVQRASFFERAGALLVIELEEDGVVRQTGKCLRAGTRGDANIGANPAQGSLDIGKFDHEVK